MSNSFMADYAEDSVVVYSGLNPTARAFQSYMEIAVDPIGVFVLDQPEGAVPGAVTGFRSVAGASAAFNGSNVAVSMPFGSVAPRSGEVARVYYDFEQVFANSGTPSAALADAPTTDTLAASATATAIKEGNQTFITKGKWASGTIGSGTAPTGTAKAQLPSEATTAGHLDIGVTQNLAAAEDISVTFRYATAPLGSNATAANQGALIVRLSYVGLSTAVV